MKLSLNELSNSNNIAELLDVELLRKLGERVQSTYDIDFNSMGDWLADVKKVEELAILKSKKKSTASLPNAANIKMPIITKAIYEYSSRTYPEIIKDDQIVKGKVLGKDFTGEKELKARKIADYMNWQLYWQNDDWELELDRLLNRLPLIGFLCKKTYYDPVRKIIKSILCEPEDLIINSSVKTLADNPRITHVIHVKLNDLVQGANLGIYCQDVVDKLLDQYENDETNPDIDLLEQHTIYDLDKDGIAEPYIITTLKDSTEVLRILARFDDKKIKKKDDKIIYIDPIQHFTDYHFLVSPKGKFQSVGFGILLLHLNETINTILNQIVDAGSLANLRGGYKDSRLQDIRSGQSRHEQGEFRNMKVLPGASLKDGILPIDYKEPSSVLYQVLGLLIDIAKDLSSSGDIMSGNSNLSNSKTGATQALLQEGVKVHNSINKRFYRSLGQELYKIFKLNGIYLDPREAQKAINEDLTTKDFDEDLVDILPVADPNLASAAKQASELQVLFALQTLPGIDTIKITERILKGVVIDKPEELLVDQTKEQPPNPEIIKIQADIQNMSEINKLKAHELELREKELQSKIYETQCRCIELKAKAALEIAQAESLEKGQQLQQYLKELDLLSQNIQAKQDQDYLMQEQQQQKLQNQHEFMLQDSQQQHEQQIQQNEINNQPVEGPIDE